MKSQYNEATILHQSQRKWDKPTRYWISAIVLIDLPFAITPISIGAVAHNDDIASRAL